MKKSGKSNDGAEAYLTMIKVNTSSGISREVEYDNTRNGSQAYPPCH